MPSDDSVDRDTTASSARGVDPARLPAEVSSVLRSLISCLGAPVLLCDARLRSVEVSPGWHAWFGETPASDPRLYTDAYEDRLPLAERLADVVDRGEPMVLTDIDFLDVAGVKRRLTVTVRPWRDSTETIRGAFAVLEDATEDPKANAEARVHQRELEQFTKRVSHDLRAPLRIAVGLLDIVNLDLNDGRTDQAVTGLDRISRKLVGMNQLLLRLFELTQVNRRVGQPRPIDLPRTVSKVLEAHAKAIQDAQFQVDTQLGRHSLVLDQDCFEQVMDNLVSNAVRFFDPQEQFRRLTIHTNEGDGVLHIEIADNGRGFSHPERAFEMFYREFSDVSGPGLGLYLVRRQVTKLGGTVALLSPAKPTVFQLTLPTT